MFEKILVAWVLSIGKVCGWYAKRSDFVAGLLYPALVAFITLWFGVTVGAAIACIAFEWVKVPFYGINGLGEDVKELADQVAEAWKMFFGDPEEEPEEEPEEPIEEFVEAVDDEDENENEVEVDDLDTILDQPEES